jgi:hypothetical protein
LWSVWTGDATPRQLRDGPPPPVSSIWTCPSNKSLVGRVRRMTGGDLAVAATFLETHYCGSSWKFVGVGDWLRGYLVDPNVVALGVFRGTLDASGAFVAAADAGLLGTIFGIPLCADGSSVYLSHGAIVRGVITVEGTCIHPDSRGTGMMNFLLAQIDAYTHMAYGRSIALWCREMSAAPLFTTALRVDTYAFRSCGPPSGTTVATTMPAYFVRKMDWTDFTELWETHSGSWITLEPCIVVPRVSSRRGGLQAFQIRASALRHTDTAVRKHVAHLVVVVGNTARIERRGELPLFEVMWCGFLDTTGRLLPSTPVLDFQQCLDAVSTHLPRGLLYGTDSLNGGGVRPSWEGWIYGRAGVHAWHLYNYIPPLFGGTRIHMLRDEF